MQNALLEQICDRYGFWRSQLIYNFKPFQQARMRRMYSQFLKPGELAFDIGAHVGNRIKCWRDLGARVVAVEPQPRFVEFLRSRFGQDSQVSIHAKGVGACAGTRQLHISRLTPTVSSFSESWMSEVTDVYKRSYWDYQISVPIQTLDQIIQQEGVPAFIKIDTEGMEREVLAGLSHAVKALSFEVLPASMSGAYECLDRLSELGDYEFNFSRTETMKWSHANWLLPSEMRSFLSTFAPDDRSGDIYGRLRGGRHL